MYKPLERKVRTCVGSMKVGFKQKLEFGFEQFALRICRYRYFVLFGVLLISAIAASGLRNITVDTSNESFLFPDDPVLVRYEEFREQFGRDDVVIIAIQSDQIFTQDFLTQLQNIHLEIEDNVPHIASITSLKNIRETRGEGDRLIVDDLLKTFPANAAELVDLKNRVLANPLYLNRLISVNADMTTIVVELDRFSSEGGVAVDDALAFFDDTAAPATSGQRLTDDEIHQVISAIEEVVTPYKKDGLDILMAGTPAVTITLKLALQDDMRTFIMMVVALILVLLLVVFRVVGAVILPLAVVFLSLVSTVGIMGHLGVSVKLPTIILPSFLLAVGVGAAIHLLEIWQQRRASGEQDHQAIASALGHAGLPILLTSLTTAVGLGSFALAEVAPIAELGLFSAVGILIALLYTLLLLPAGLAILPAGKVNISSTYDRNNDKIGATLASIAAWSVRNAKPICSLSAVILVASLLIAGQLRFSHDILAWLPSEWPIRQATEAVDRNMGGSVSLEVVIDTKVENGLHNRETLSKIDRLSMEIEEVPVGTISVGSTLSIAGLLKEIHQALNENRPEFYRIPENERLIPQEFILFENSGSDDVEDLVDSSFRIARLSLRVPWRDTLEYAPFINTIINKFDNALVDTANIDVTGMMSLFSRTLEAAILTTAKSYTIAFGAITLMMILLIGRIGSGLISMIPNLTPIAITLAIMQMTGIPLNLFTMLVASIAIGLAVDDTIHFMHHFHRYLDKYGDVELAVCKTLQTSGRAMLTTSVILSAGFFIFCFASMNNLIQFGLLTGLTILLALAADFVLAPALMSLRYGKSTKSRGQEER